MNSDLDDLKKSIDIVKVIGSYDVELKKGKGNEWVGKCPFHDDKTASFSVNSQKRVYQCFGCGAKGNVFQFVADKEGVSLHEAKLKLCARIPGVVRASELPSFSQPLEKAVEVVEVDPVTRATLLARVVGFYAKTLHKDRAGLDYLRARKLTDPVMLETFQVGYCNGVLRNTLPSSGELVEQLKAIGILNENGNECFYGRIVVPIYDSAGNVVQLYGRRLDDAKPKHIYLKGERCGVFNSYAAKSAKSIIVTEGVLKSMALWQNEIRNTIALFGSGGWTKNHETLVKESDLTEIILALDNDETGQSASETLESRLREMGIAVHRIAWPDGVKDANDFFATRTADDFRALLPQSTAKKATAGKEEDSSQKEESIQFERTRDGLIITLESRKYQLCAIEKPSASRLKAAIRAIAGERFAIDTVDFYLLRSRRGFISEAAKLFRETVDILETDFNQITKAVEAYIVDQAQPEKPAAPTLSEAEKVEATKFGLNPDLVGELQRDLGKLGIIGEEINRLLLYLGMTSRKMDDPIAIQILSSYGAGKSHLQDAVLSLCPSEDLIKLTSISDQALFYKGEDSLRHKCLAIAEIAGAMGARYALRSLISDKKIVRETTVKNPTTGRMETQVSTVYGPAAMFETTTQPETDPETKSRYFITSIDESEAQTRAIMEAQRQSHTLEGRKRSKARELVLRKHHTFQRMLQRIEVMNPYEPLLTYGDDRLLFRRDFPKYLHLILTITFLYQMQRPRRHDPDCGEFIETTLADIAIANELAHALFGQSVDDLSFPSRQLLGLLGDYVTKKTAESGESWDKIEVTRRELREAFRWTEARLRQHLDELVRLEYVLPTSGRFGQRFTYRLGIDPNQIRDGARFVPGLKEVEQIRKEAELAGIGQFGENLAAQKGYLAGENRNLAPTSQVVSCEVLSAAKSYEEAGYGINGHNLAVNGREHIREFVNTTRCIVELESLR